MKHSIVLLALCAHLLLNAQNSANNIPVNSNMQSQDSGIEWVRESNWLNVLAKAKAEKKYIFVDCYATWCGPCIKMDKEVYPNDKVGKMVNEKFICVKLQMDKTELDDEQVKKWYYDATNIQKLYAVNSFPTFLFFSPDGKPIHKAVGYKSADDFVSLSEDALEPQKQYYAIANNYAPGKFDTSELKGLATSFRLFDKELAWKLAEEYFSRIPKKQWGSTENQQFMISFRESLLMQRIVTEYLRQVPLKKFNSKGNIDLVGWFQSVLEVSDLGFKYLNRLQFSEMKMKDNLLLLRMLKKDTRVQVVAQRYISRLKTKELFTKQNIELLNDFIVNTADKNFQFFYHNAASIDSVMEKKGYALKIVDSWIDKENISPFWEDALKEKLDWSSVHSSIEKKYSKEIADRVVLNSRVFLYKYFVDKKIKAWDDYLTLAVEKNLRYPDTTGGFWEEYALNEVAWHTFLYSADTQKLSHAVTWMDGVVRRNPKDHTYLDTYANLLYKLGRKEEAIAIQMKAIELAPTSKSLHETLRKMKEGLPTW